MLELTTTEMETVMVMETQVQVMVAKNLPLSESAICQGPHHRAFSIPTNQPYIH